MVFLGSPTVNVNSLVLLLYKDKEPIQAEVEL
jgi:hypothetical protein